MHYEIARVTGHVNVSVTKENTNIKTSNNFVDSELNRIPNTTIRGKIGASFDERFRGAYHSKLNKTLILRYTVYVMYALFMYLTSMDRRIFFFHSYYVLFVHKK